jgi:hypothetical protein
MSLNIVVVDDGAVLAVHLDTPQDSVLGHERQPRLGA